ncbi:ATP-binding protein [Rubrivirga sp. IMCC45206]|uniref:ATP-binding protein n=1 Tax=Rubrivirga sp. IMCC45206 TaxID=3391614 RepID=UPI00398F9009
MPSRWIVGVAALLAAGALAQPAAPADVPARVTQLTRAALDAPSPDRGRALAEEALALARQAGSPTGVGQSLHAVAYARYHQGEVGTDRLFSQAAATARRAGDRRTEGVARAWQGMVVGDRDRDRGLALGRRAVAVHEAIPGAAGRRAVLVSLNMLANQHTFAGQAAEAAALHRQIVREARTLGDAKSVGLSSLSLGDMALAAGDLVGALGHYDDAETAAVAADAETDWGTDARAGRARVDAALGRVDVAAATLRQLAAAETAQGHAGYASGYYQLLGDVLREAGRTTEAIAAYQAGYDVLATSDFARYRFEFRVLEAAARAGDGWSEAARRALRPAADSVLAAPSDPGVHALALTLLAREARLGGRPDQAAAYAARATSVADGAALAGPARDAYAERADALEDAGDPAGALAAFRQSAALSDSLRSTEQAREVGRLQAEATFADERTDADRRRRRLWTGLLALLAIGGLGTAFGVGHLRTVRRANAEIGRQADALASANADLAQTNAVVREAREAQARFFQTAGHELRTPLTLTVGPLDDLLRERHGPLPPDVRRAADLAFANASRLRRLVDDLLDAARLDAGQTPFQPAPTELAALVEASAQRFHALAERSDVTLAVDAGAPLLAVVDAATVERALGNVVANALRHTPAGGRVEVRLRGGEGEARISVADTGDGIASDALPHLFERFYRADERAGVGTGLGLALAREWTERHGGRVEVASAPGAGATFTLVLPLPDPTLATDADGHTARAPVPDDDALLVLVAEDHDDLRAYVAGHLERDLGEPVRVVQAADGDAALALALDLLPDLVVSDVMMPGLDGFALTRALKADRRTSHVPVLLLTARADAPGAVAGFEAGADGYLAKPFDADVLRAQAAGLIAERRRLRAGAGPAANPAGTGATGTPARQRSAGGDSAPGELQAPGLSVADRRFLREVDGAIAAGIGDPQFGAEALAREVALSPRQLRRKLRAVTSDTPVTRIRRARVEAAEGLLADGLSLTEAAGAVGYADSGGLRRALSAVRGTRED